MDAAWKYNSAFSLKMFKMLESLVKVTCKNYYCQEAISPEMFAYLLLLLLWMEFTSKPCETA